jgi:RHS repeat-associated protein
MRFNRLHLALLLAGAVFAAPELLGQADSHTLGSFAYDGSGNVTSMGPDSEGLTNEYEYDSAGRLIRFVRKNHSTGATVVTESYDYDAYGNQTKQTTNNAVTSLPADASTNRLTGATYDQAGNMTQYGGESYTFDPVGTMTTKSGWWGTATYVYTADDERIAIEGPDATWRYTARDLDGKVLREWSAPSWNGSWTWAEDYVYRDGQLAAAVRPVSQGGTRHFHLDHLGSPRLISSETKLIYAEHAYYPFGREITSPIQELAFGHDTPEPMKFTGHERDFAGSYSGPTLDYMHARYYNPGAGRFLSVDPVYGESSQPQLWNRYSYVMNSPLCFADPDGQQAIIVTGRRPEQLHPETDDGVAQFVSGNVGWFFRGMTSGRGRDHAFSPMLAAYYSGWNTVWSRFGEELEPDDELDVFLTAVSFIPLGRLAKPVAKPGATAIKRALAKAHAKVGKLPKGRPGKFGSPQRGTSIKGYRLDPPHPRAKPGSPETKWHINFWDYTGGKRGAGGVKDAIPIE